MKNILRQAHLIISALAVTLLITGCSKNDDDTEPRYDSPVANTISFLVQDKDGKDLLDNSQRGTYGVDDIHYTYNYKGKRRVRNTAGQTHSKGFYIQKDTEGTNRIVVYLLNPLRGKTEEKIYLEFVGNEQDEIRAQFKIETNDKSDSYLPAESCVVEKIWLNGKLVYDLADPSEDPIVVIKKSKV